MSLLRASQRSLMVVRLENPWRFFSASSVYNEKPAVPSSDKPSEVLQDKSSASMLRDGTNHKVDNLEKRFLVWSGRYKRIEDVPPTVPQGTMEKARNRVRIKIANYMMLATVVGCIGYIYSGKQAAKRGDSVAKRNLDWHKEINEQAAKAEAAK